MRQFTHTGTGANDDDRPLPLTLFPFTRFTRFVRFPSKLTFQFWNYERNVFTSLLSGDRCAVAFERGRIMIGIALLGAGRMARVHAKAIQAAGARLVTASGKQAVILDSRRATYGSDQRIEAFGSAGMVISDNPRATGLKRYSSTSFGAPDRLLNSKPTAK